MFFGNVNTGLSVCGLSCCGPPAPQSKLWGALDTQHADLSPWCTRGRSNQAGHSPHCIQSLPSRQTGKSKCLPTSTHATECHILLWCVVQVAKVTVLPPFPAAFTAKPLSALKPRPQSLKHPPPWLGRYCSPGGQNVTNTLHGGCRRWSSCLSLLLPSVLPPATI